MGKNKSKKRGKMASRHGKEFERLCMSIFIRYGFRVISNKEYCNNIKTLRNTFGNKIIVRNANYESVYKTNSRTEFLVIWFSYNENSKRFNRLIFPVECKYQTSSGTADEKFSFLIESSLTRKEKNILIVHNITGARALAQEYLCGGWKKVRAANGELLFNPSAYSDKHIHMLNFQQFVMWMNNKFSNIK